MDRLDAATRLHMHPLPTRPLDPHPQTLDGRHPWRALGCDLRRTYDYSHGSRLRRCLNCARAPGVHTVIVLRYGQWAAACPALARLLLDPVYFVLNGLIKVLWGIEIPRATRIGPGLYIGHFGGITVSSGAVIGANCNLSQGITIEVSGQGEHAGSPCIGDSVYIAPGARLFGKISIGDNVKIGANAVIHSDVPAGSIAVLDPGFRLISSPPQRAAEGAEP